MRGWKGLLSGALALVLLQVLVSSRNAGAGVSGVFGGAANLAEKLMDPTVPAIPARTTAPKSPVTATAVTQQLPGYVPYLPQVFGGNVAPASSATPSPASPASPAVPSSTQPLWS